MFAMCFSSRRSVWCFCAKMLTSGSELTQAEHITYTTLQHLFLCGRKFFGTETRAALSQKAVAPLACPCPEAKSECCGIDT